MRRLIPLLVLLVLLPIASREAPAQDGGGVQQDLELQEWMKLLKAPPWEYGRTPGSPFGLPPEPDPAAPDDDEPYTPVPWLPPWPVGGDDDDDFVWPPDPPPDGPVAGEPNPTPLPDMPYDPNAYPPPSLEETRQLLQRAQRMIERLWEEHDGHPVVSNFEQVLGGLNDQFTSGELTSDEYQRLRGEAVENLQRARSIAHDRRLTDRQRDEALKEFATKKDIDGAYEKVSLLPHIGEKYDEVPESEFSGRIYIVQDNWGPLSHGFAMIPDPTSPTGFRRFEIGGPGFNVLQKPVETISSVVGIGTSELNMTFEPRLFEEVQPAWDPSTGRSIGRPNNDVAVLFVTPAVHRALLIEAEKMYEEAKTEKWRYHVLIWTDETKQCTEVVREWLWRGGVYLPDNTAAGFDNPMWLPDAARLYNDGYRTYSEPGNWSNRLIDFGQSLIIGLDRVIGDQRHSYDEEGNVGTTGAFVQNDVDRPILVPPELPGWVQLQILVATQPELFTVKYELKPQYSWDDLTYLDRFDEVETPSDDDDAGAPPGGLDAPAGGDATPEADPTEDIIVVPETPRPADDASPPDPVYTVPRDPVLYDRERDETVEDPIPYDPSPDDDSDQTPLDLLDPTQSGLDLLDPRGNPLDVLPLPPEVGRPPVDPVQPPRDGLPQPGDGISLWIMPPRITAPRPDPVPFDDYEPPPTVFSGGPLLIDPTDFDEMITAPLIVNRLSEPAADDCPVIPPETQYGPENSLQAAPNGDGAYRVEIDPAEALRTYRLSDEPAPAPPSEARAQGRQWALERIGLLDPRLRAAAARAPYLAEPLIVAVIDSGVDALHSDLDGQLWWNTGEIPENGVDDDGNGWIDDIDGYNTFADSPDVRDDNGHGTHVVGIIAARWNGHGVGGVYPGCRLMIVKAFDGQGASDPVRVALAIRYAVLNGAAIINLSAENDRPHPVEQAMIDWAASHNVLVVVAAGSHGRDVSEVSPAGLRNVLTVAATDRDDRRARFSGWGAAVDLSAPGVDVLSLRAAGSDFLVGFDDAGTARAGQAVVGGRWYAASGSSFAAPHVAGAAALLWSINPALTAEQLRRRLLMGCDDIEQPGWDESTGAGRLNVARALESDPAAYLHAAISALRRESANGQAGLRVVGSAEGPRLASRSIELAFGADPAEADWETVSTVTGEVADGTLGLVPGRLLNRRGTWWVRCVAQGADGATATSRRAFTID